MPVEKWYDGKYYNKCSLMQTENDESEWYWGIENASITIHTPSPSLLNALSGRSSLSASEQVTLIEKNDHLDSIDKEIVARIAASGLLTKKQLTDYLKLCGLIPIYWDPLVESGIMQRRLNNLFTSELIEKVIISYNNGLPYLIAYRITRLGEKLAHRQGVRIHSGNRYQSKNERMKTGLLDTPAEIMRVIVANNIALRFLNETDDVKYLDFMSTHYLKGVKTMSGITRNALTVIKENGQPYFLEIFRRPDIHDTNREQYENYIKDKIRRYFYLVQNENFLEKNVHNLKTIPKLVIVAEDPSHLDELEKMLTPIVELLRVDERAEVIFITDYGVCTGKIYNPQFFDE